MKEILKQNLVRFRNESSRVKEEMQKQLVGYIVAGFGLVAGLAWNDAIRSLIEYLFPLSKNNLQAKFIYAILVTGFIGLITVYIIRLFSKREEKRND